jgi:hypothetical protein
MCNCGNKRNELFAELVINEVDNRDYIEITPGNPGNKDTWFEYIGKTALTVIGPGTGNYYRYYSPGEVQIIHADDVAGMMNVGVLRMVPEEKES